METKKAYSMIGGYFEYLKSMGAVTPCDTRKHLLVPLLVDLESGPLSIYRTEDDKALLKRIELSFFL